MPHAKLQPMQLDLEHKEEHCLSGKLFLRTHLYVALIFQDFPKTRTLSIKAYKIYFTSVSDKITSTENHVPLYQSSALLQV